MKRQYKHLLILLIVSAALVQCSQYGPITKPLQGVAANCYCRYADMAKHYYRCKLSDYLHEGLSEQAAKDSAVIDTNKKIGATMIAVARGKNLRCDCLENKGL